MAETITIKFFASLREQLDCQDLTLELTQEMKSVQDVKLAIVKRHPNWADALEQSKLLSAVNHNMVSSDHAIAPNDEIAFFPPVTGG
ncbi:molybdopterin converting factor subunit 1 [Thalassotalea sp. LPB0316]|uniref:molybdopterin converting factor subunit 1 n=1 Tax=Thalassotalea sp. LPB0316 TaxID=2769490 RepID=UPI001867C04A|nr:molybdopterin converting factor subunit 1 [Thalassotalea sp. LPB0316]QOL25738.1 molybdopterin converting factor subunit 1 [Thalassotalea sp. LPB0316]